MMRTLDVAVHTLSRPRGPADNNDAPSWQRRLRSEHHNFLRNAAATSRSHPTIPPVTVVHDDGSNIPITAIIGGVGPSSIRRPRGGLIATVPVTPVASRPGSPGDTQAVPLVSSNDVSPSSAPDGTSPAPVAAAARRDYVITVSDDTDSEPSPAAQPAVVDDAVVTALESTPGGADDVEGPATGTLA